jgi:hypothetical protein
VADLKELKIRKKWWERSFWTKLICPCCLQICFQTSQSNKLTIGCLNSGKNNNIKQI